MQHGVSQDDKPNSYIVSSPPLCYAGVLRLLPLLTELGSETCLETGKRKESRPTVIALLTERPLIMKYLRWETYTCSGLADFSRARYLISATELQPTCTCRKLKALDSVSSRIVVAAAIKNSSGTGSSVGRRSRGSSMPTTSSIVSAITGQVAFISHYGAVDLVDQIVLLNPRHKHLRRAPQHPYEFSYHISGCPRKSRKAVKSRFHMHGTLMPRNCFQTKSHFWQVLLPMTLQRCSQALSWVEGLWFMASWADVKGLT